MGVFVRRRGRFTQGQRRALEQLTDRYVIEPEAIAARAGPAQLGIEIGFGMGQALVQWAREAPDWRLVGVEVYQPGIGSLMAQLESESLASVSVVEADAAWLVADVLQTASVDECRILFPDPWPKARHAKRRLIQPAFAADLARIIKPGGIVRLATDWQPYADWMLEVLDAEPALVNTAGSGCFDTRDPERPKTRFEARGQRLGHEIRDLTYRRRDAR